LSGRARGEESFVKIEKTVFTAAKRAAIVVDPGGSVSASRRESREIGECTVLLNEGSTGEFLENTIEGSPVGFQVLGGSPAIRQDTIKRCESCAVYAAAAATPEVIDNVFLDDTLDVRRESNELCEG
jgi:hypothetical protein